MRGPATNGLARNVPATKEVRFLLAIVVVVAACFAHGPSLTGGWVYDDHRLVQENEALRRVTPVTFLLDPATASDPEGIQPDVYRPLRTLFFALEGTLLGFEPSAFRVASLLLHALNALLVFCLAVPLLAGRLSGAFVAGLIFAVHPVTSESVAWVSSQGDLLAMTGMLLALLVLRAPGPFATAAGMICFALACLAKESALVFPALLFLADRARRFASESGPRSPEAARAGKSAGGSSLSVRLALCAVVLALYFALRQTAMEGRLAQLGHPGGSWLESLKGFLAAVPGLARALFVPMAFTFASRAPVPGSFGDPDVVWGAALILGTLLAGLYGLRAQRPRLALACLGVLATLVPVSNVIVPLKTFMADRFLYPGLFGLAVGAGALLPPLAKRLRRPALAGAVVLAVFLGLWSRARDQAWASDESLWTAVRAQDPSHPEAWYGLAHAWRTQHRLREAERAYRTWLAASPLDGKARFELGLLFREVALTLEQVGVGAPETAQASNLYANRRLARLAEIDAYRDAWETWQRYGLDVGRGSPELRDAMMALWTEAAVDVGDLREARMANDVRLALRGIDPRDRGAVRATAPWTLRRHRYLLALRALSVDLPAEEEARRMRAQVLEDLGLDPRRDNRDLLSPWLEGAAHLQQEADAAGRPPDAALYAHRVRTLVQLDRVDQAQALLREARLRLPEDPLLASVAAETERAGTGGR